MLQWGTYISRKFVCIQYDVCIVNGFLKYKLQVYNCCAHIFSNKARSDQTRTDFDNSVHQLDFLYSQKLQTSLHHLSTARLMFLYMRTHLLLHLLHLLFQTSIFHLLTNSNFFILSLVKHYIPFVYPVDKHRFLLELFLSRAL